MDASSTLVPSWIRIWYLINLLVLIPDAFYILLRPRSLEGGDLAWLFPVFNLYAQVDKLFEDHTNKVTVCIYRVGIVDLLVVLYMFATFRSNANKPFFAILAICRAVCVATKTLVYLMYSSDYIAEKWWWPVELMNGIWVYMPLVVGTQVSRRICEALTEAKAKES